VEEVKGACVILKREVADKLMAQDTWILDERYGMGGGDDNDICRRVRKNNYKVGISRESFIYHYGSAAFRELFNHDVDYSKKYAVTQFNKYRSKYKDELGEKPRIFIGLPCADGKLHIELALRLIQWTHDPAFIVKIFPASHLFPLDNARNFIVKNFLEDYFDYLVMIDNDIVPPVNTLRELVAADKDVIAPLCFTVRVDDDGLMAPIPVAHRYDSEGKYRPYYGQGVEETDVITGGMMMIKRHVLEKIDRPFYFTYHSNGIVEYSEDFVFSQQVQKLGLKLYTHYGLLCKHMKTLDIKSLNDLLIKVTSKGPGYGSVKN
jgi:GT2 family glycosyltransferase